MDAWYEFVKSQLVSDVIDTASFQLVSARNDELVTNVLRRMTEARVQSVPVRDSNGRWLGLVDMLDLVTLVISMSDSKLLIEAFAQKPIGWDTFLDRELAVLKEQTIGPLCNASERDTWCPLTPDLPLETALDLFALHCGVHRLPVIGGKNDDVIAVLSQSATCRWLLQTLRARSDLTGFLSRRVSELPEKPDGVVTVRFDSLAIDAYRTMLEKNLSGVAVVYEDGKLFGSLSVSDLKGSAPDQLFTDLYLPLATYLEKSTAAFGRENAVSPVSCAVDANFEDVLQKMMSRAVHRVFVVDDQRKPISVVSTSDVITFFCPQLYRKVQ